VVGEIEMWKGKIDQETIKYASYNSIRMRIDSTGVQYHWVLTDFIEHSTFKNIPIFHRRGVASEIS